MLQGMYARSIVTAVALAVSPCLLSGGCGVDEVKTAHLRDHGVAAEATVISIQPLGVIVNRSLHLLRLELDIPMGTEAAPIVTRVFTDYYVPVLAFPAVQPKSKIPIRYDPAKPADVFVDFPAMGYR